MAGRFLTYTIADLQKLDRKRLQLLCKVFGVNSTNKTSILLDTLTTVAKEDDGLLQIVPFSTDLKEATLTTIKKKEPIQVALTKFRSQSIGRIYEVGRETKRRKSKNIHSTEDGVKEYYPSVTTVLDRTKTYSQRIALLRWKEAKIRELGKEGFNTMSREILASGTSFHKILSDHLKEVSSKDKIAMETDITNKLEKNSTLHNLVQSVSHVLQQVSFVFAIESSIQHPLLRYAGTLDCILEIDGKVCLVDWKTSSKYRRTIDSLYDYPIQAVAYAGAANFDCHYDFQTKNICLAVAYEDGSPADLHILSPEQCEEYWLLWLARLSSFYKDYPWESFQDSRQSLAQSKEDALVDNKSSPEASITPRTRISRERLKLTNFLALSGPILKKYISFSKK